MMAMFIITCLLFVAIGQSIVLHPELRYRTKDAVVVGSVLLLAYVIAMFDAGGHLHVTINEVLDTLFSFLSPSRYIGG